MTARRTKYNANKVKLDGYTFDSQAEARRYRELLLAQKAGEINQLKVHPRFKLIAGFTYKGKRVRPVFYEADFEYWQDGRHVVEDVKGFETAVFKIKMKLFLCQYPEVDFRITKV